MLCILGSRKRLHRELCPWIGGNQWGRWGTYNYCGECQWPSKEGRNTSGNEEGFSSEGRAKPEDRLQEEGEIQASDPSAGEGERVRRLGECGIKPWWTPSAYTPSESLPVNLWSTGRSRLFTRAEGHAIFFSGFCEYQFSQEFSPGPGTEKALNRL